MQPQSLDRRLRDLPGSSLGPEFTYLSTSDSRRLDDIRRRWGDINDAQTSFSNMSSPLSLTQSSRPRLPGPAQTGIVTAPEFLRGFGGVNSQPVNDARAEHFSPGTTVRDSSSEELRRRRKRRKIDHENGMPGSGLNGFRYGYKGAVVPGRLKMEIASCDGGVVDMLTMHDREYAPENVLRNDQSVYCTHHGQCNLLLRHIGETSFSLTKVVIKSPATGFTAP